jgi:hypothetical protein
MQVLRVLSNSSKFSTNGIVRWQLGGDNDAVLAFGAAFALVRFPPSRKSALILLLLNQHSLC